VGNKNGKKQRVPGNRTKKRGTNPKIFVALGARQRLGKEINEKGKGKILLNAERGEKEKRRGVRENKGNSNFIHYLPGVKKKKKGNERDRK